MGDRGPAPKRSDQRRRVNAPAVEAKKTLATEPVVIPKSDPDWHFVARQWFDSLERSPQSQWYTDTDWSSAYMTADAMSREFMPQPVTLGRGDTAETVMVELPPKAASLMAWLKAGSQLLMCEGDRRRVGVELQFSKSAQSDGGGDVSWIDDARRHLHSAG